METEIYQISASSIDQTRRLGQTIGAVLHKRILLAMSGDLGSGKTTFVQGLAKGIGVPDDCYITSPTYTLINEYPGRLPLIHVDLYRISTADEIDDIGLLDIFREHGVTAIEWAEKITDDLPPERIDIVIHVAENETRQIELTAYGSEAQAVIVQIKQRLKETT